MSVDSVQFLVLFIITWKLFGCWFYLFLKTFTLLKVQGWFDHARLYCPLNHTNLYFKFTYKGGTCFAVMKTKDCNLPAHCEEREFSVAPKLFKRGYYKVTTVDRCEVETLVFSIFLLIWCFWFATYGFPGGGSIVTW